MFEFLYWWISLCLSRAGVLQLLSWRHIIDHSWFGRTLLNYNFRCILILSITSNTFLYINKKELESKKTQVKIFPSTPEWNSGYTAWETLSEGIYYKHTEAKNLSYKNTPNRNLPWSEINFWTNICKPSRKFLQLRDLIQILFAIQ